MSKFHLTADGLPAPCKAKHGNCPLAPAGEHYETKLEALVAAEEKLLQENELFAPQTKKDTVYHLSDKGAVEECSYREGYCNARPYQKYNSPHTTDRAEAESAARALREIQARAAQAANTSAPVQKPLPKTPKRRAVDPVTEEARKIRNDGYDRYRQQGWTEDEIKQYKDSCGHWTPSRFKSSYPSNRC